MIGHSAGVAAFLQTFGIGGSRWRDQLARDFFF
jgi:hypothetical protein